MASPMRAVACCSGSVPEETVCAAFRSAIDRLTLKAEYAPDAVAEQDSGVGVIWTRIRRLCASPQLRAMFELIVRGSPITSRGKLHPLTSTNDCCRRISFEVTSRPDYRCAWEKMD
jgi:hypothetical protein